MLPTGCLTLVEIDGFLAGNAAEGEAIEHHLSGCSACRSRLVERYRSCGTASEMRRAPRWLKAKARRLPTGSRWPNWLTVLPRPRWAAFAASAIIVAGLTTLWTRPGSLSNEATDSPSSWRLASDLAPEPQLLTPVPGATVTSAAVELRWSAVPGARRYTVTLLDEKGDVLLQRSTSTTSLTLSASSAGVDRERVRFWLVTAGRSDGTEATSSVAAFEWRE